MISIIVPAYNEEAAIARGLRAMVSGAAPGELDVIVACNGCADRTAEIARSFGAPVRVIEIHRASKTAALNAAEEMARGFPRFYVDADVVLDLRSIRAMAATLENTGVLYVTPVPHADMSAASWCVRAFYRVWRQLPYNRVGGRVGAGAYALSRAARKRFDRFPDVINDDGFVRYLFAPSERATASDAVSIVAPPRTFAGLLRAKTRVRAGQLQLRRLYPAGPAADRAAAGSLWRWGLAHPELWPLLPVYLATNLIARRRAARSLETRRIAWERDDSREESLA